MYDISDNKRRIKVEKLLSSYGYRVNYSVFECIITSKILDKIVQELKEITKKEDNIRIYNINKDSLKKSFTLYHGDVFNEQELYF